MPSFPLGEFPGMTVSETGRGRATAHLDAGALHRNPHGFVHGATVFAMVEGGLRAETSVIKPGRRVVHVESRVTDATGQLIATATASFAVLDEANL